MGDLRLLEDGSERGGAFVSDVVLKETEKGVGEAGKAREQACQRALTERRTLGRVGAPQRGHGAPPEPLAELGDALGGVGAVATKIDAAELVEAQAAKERRRVNGH